MATNEGVELESEPIRKLRPDYLPFGRHYSLDSEEVSFRRAESEDATRWRRKTMHARWLVCALTVVNCTLLLILILVFELKFNCSHDASGGTRETNVLPENHEALKFFLISDFHLDPLYKANVSAKDYCRVKVGGTAADYEAPYGRIGCDSPDTLLNTLFKDMKDVNHEEEVSFVLLTGDLVAHNLWTAGGDAQRVLNTILQASNLTHNAFPDIPVFLLFGNNDLPGHYILPNETSTWYKSVLDKWAPMILCSECPQKVPQPTDMPTLHSTFLKGGYYNVSIADGQAVLLVLNSMYWAVKSSKGEYIHDLAVEHMEWLQQQLQLAKARGQKAFLAGHIPPGIDPYDGMSFWWPNYTHTYTNLVAKEYSDVVAGQFYAHIHKDDFHLQMANDIGLPSSVGSASFALLSPSVSPVYKNNPAFRVVSYDIESKALLDYEQYYMDIVMATEFSNRVWQLDYSFNRKYRSANRFIDAQRIYELNEQLINQTTNEVWVEYISSRQTHYQLDPYSRFELYCSMRNLYQERFHKCRDMYKVPGG